MNVFTIKSGKYSIILPLLFNLSLMACSKNTNSSSGYHDPHSETAQVIIISPSRGSIFGNTLITIYGSGLKVGSRIHIGKVECTSPTYLRSTILTCLTGPNSRGHADVIVTLPDHQTASLASGFDYYSPRPTVERVEPNQGLESESTRITLTGNNFAPGIEVHVGWLDCTNIVVHSRTTLSCSTYPRNYPGVTSIGVRNPPSSYETLESAFTYHSAPTHPPNPNTHTHNTTTHTPARPAATAHSLGQNPRVADLPATARPSVPHLEHFTGSEAQVLKNFFQTRITRGTFLNHVTINNRDIDISNSNAPDELLRGYTIQSPNLALRISNSGSGIHIEAGATLSQPQVDTLPELIREEIVDAIGNGVNVENNTFPNPTFHPRPTTTEQNHYLEYLRTEVKRQITNLNNNSEYRFLVPAIGNRSSFSYYINPLHMHGMIVGRTQSLAEAFNINLDTYTGRTSAYLWPRVHENQYDRETLQHLMEAIEHNNESSFITNLVHFATSFDSETTGPKAAFIDAFTFLYVTKNFPSEALRQLYFHFILRCGQIH